MMRLLMISKLLAANLEEADPAVYEILQRVRYTLNHDSLNNKYKRIFTDAWNVGEKKAETLHQSHTLRKLHIASST